MRASAAFVIVFCGTTLLTTGAAAQGYLYATGSPSFSSQIPVQNGFIDLNNGNLHIELSLVSRPQRGSLRLNERLVYDSRIWKIVNNGTQSWQPTNVPGSAGGWRFTTGLETGTIGYNGDEESYDTGEECQVGHRQEYDVTETWTVFSQFTWTDPQGTTHMFPVETSQPIVMCNGDDSHTKANGTGYALDSSGYYLVVSQYSNMTIYDSKGNQVYPQIQDTNGNYFSADGSGNLIDTQGNTPIVVGTSGNQTYYDVLATGGATRNRYTATWGTISFSTSFGQSGVAEASGSFSALTQLQLPDGSSYTFNYDAYGELNSVTLPTGGTESFGYTTFSDVFGNTNRWISSRARDGGTTTITPYVSLACSETASCVEEATVMSPTGDETDYYMNVDSGQTANSTSETQEIDAYQGSELTGTRLATQYSQYTWQEVSSSDGAYTYQSPTQTSQVLQYASGRTTQTVTSLANGTLPSTVSVWDYYTGSQPANATQITTNDYGYTVNAAPLVTQTTVTDGGGHQISQTTYGYDGSSLTATSGLPNHTSVSSSRGNLTSVSQWLNTSGTIQTSGTYDDAGTLLSSTTPNGTTTYGHDANDTFVTGMTPPTPSSGVTLTSTQSFDASSGVLLSTTDPNGQTTHYQNFDQFDRPQQLTYPDGGSETLAYSQNEITETKYVNQNVTTGTQTDLDGYGRTSNVITFDGSQQFRKDTCYDTNGRIAFTSVPYVNGGGSNVCSGSGVAYTYDALARPTQISEPDGTTTKVYAGTSVETTNPIGVVRIVQNDVFGRPILVCEVAGSLPDGEQPTNCGTDISAQGFVTSYQYDLDPNLSYNQRTTITQGSQTRVFETDSVGRTVSTTEPEVGLTTYSYAYNGTGLVVARTKPRANQTNSGTTTTTTYQYDSVSRILSTGYSDGTSTKTYQYDTNAAWPWSNFSPTNLKGRMYLAYNSSAPAATTYSYDPMGRIDEMAECLPSGCGNAAYDKHILYSYDWTGNVTSETDDANGTIAYSRSPAGEITSVTNQTYTLTGGAGQGTLISNMQNGPFGPTTWQWGNGLSGARYYDNSGRISSQWLCRGSTQVNCAGGTDPHFGFDTWWTGSYLTYTCEDVIGQCASETYDQLGRLSAYNVAAGNPGSYSYTYDRYGNRLQQNVTSGSGPSPTYLMNASNNQITTFAYDAAGNMLNDGVHSYTYDADGNVTAIDGGSTAQYTYDALNHRVRWQAAGFTIENVFDAMGNNTALWWPSHVPADGHIFADGQQIALRGSDGQTYFVHQDWLNTDRVHTDPNGNWVGTWASLPFGDGGTLTSGGGPGTLDFGRFAGIDGDPGSSTNEARFRQYNPTAGRWMSPDPYAGSYDASDPQSMNRYAYVLNQPFNYVDPQGLAVCIVYSVPDQAALHGDGNGTIQKSICFGTGAGSSGGGPDIGKLRKRILTWIKNHICGGTFNFAGVEADGGEGGMFAGGIAEHDSTTGDSKGSLVEGWLGGEGPVLGAGKITTSKDTSFLNGIFSFVGGGVSLGPAAAIQGGVVGGKGWLGTYLEGHVGPVAWGGGNYLSGCKAGG